MLIDLILVLSRLLWQLLVRLGSNNYYPSNDFSADLHKHLFG
uniref:Uncharacterized protein n=1 Tax=Picea glauca TaxID=3330 RepID=A0A101LYW0_PICGL|nr:hypothetical protein ABT39_MTgene5915 [Picea glauca]